MNLIHGKKIYIISEVVQVLKYFAFLKPGFQISSFIFWSFDQKTPVRQYSNTFISKFELNLKYTGLEELPNLKRGENVLVGMAQTNHR